MIYISYFILNFFSLLFMVIYILIGVAFLTLLERKILGYIQIRKGPNKLGFNGIFQPFSDAIKLFNKEFYLIYKSSYMIYYICPMILMFMMLSMWMLSIYITNIYYLNYSLLILIMLLTLMGYMFLFMGWSSNSLYSLIGAVRAISQTLSYEVSLILIFLVVMILSESYSYVDFIKWQYYLWYMVILYPLFFLFFISVLAEMNRSPMDFVEGESELVSGFNVEYFSGSFALIFMAEYGSIIFWSYLMTMMFTNLVMNFVGSWVLFNLMILVVIFVRGCLPRMRYDGLMYLCWKIILPFILNFMVFILMYKFIFSLMI